MISRVLLSASASASTVIVSLMPLPVIVVLPLPVATSMALSAASPVVTAMVPVTFIAVKDPVRLLTVKSLVLALALIQRLELSARLAESTVRS